MSKTISRISVMSKTISVGRVPRISFSLSIGFGYWLGVPLLSSPISVSTIVWSVCRISIVSITPIMSKAISISGIPGVGFSLSIGFSYWLGFPLLSSPISVSTIVWSVCGIAIMSKTIPGISVMSKTITIGRVPRIGFSLSIGFGYWLSFPLLSSPIAVSTIVWSVCGIAIMSKTISRISVMSKTISIGRVPRISFSLSIGFGNWLGFPLLSSPISISTIVWPVCRISMVSISAIMSKAISISGIPRVGARVSLSCWLSFCHHLGGQENADN